MKIADRVISTIALPVIGLAAILLVLGFTLSVKGQNNESNAYIRVINCIVSYPANTRTSKDVESCYTNVETQMHIKLQRYDSSNK